MCLDSGPNVGSTDENGTNAVPALFLFDAEHKQLTLCEREAAGVWKVVKNLELPVTTFSASSRSSSGKPKSCVNVRSLTTSP